MTAYIFQVVLFQLLFLLGYEILLKRETFFTWNRWYLLVTAVFSILLPFIKIEGLSLLLTEDSIPEISNAWMSNVMLAEPQSIEPLATGEISNKAVNINWWLIAYSLGVCGSVFLFKKKYHDLERLFRFRTIAAEGKLNIIEVPNSNIACTFYNTIFLGDQLAEAEKQQILSHELVHVKQKHSLDLVFFEILKIIFWFNPLIYIYQSRIATLHEFIADAAVVKNTGKRSYYEQLLNSAFSTKDISFVNQFFNQSLTRLTAFGRTITFGNSGGQVKKRIIMLQKSRSKATAKFKFLVLLPLMLVMLTFTAYSFEQEIPAPDTSSEIITIEVNDLDNLSEEQKELIDSKVSLVMEKRAYRSLIVKDVNKTLEFTVDPETGGNVGKIYPTPGEEVPAQPIPDIPFAVVDEAPVFPGCEGLQSVGARKDCMAENVNNFVKVNISREAVNLYTQPEGGNVTVVFRIDETGKVTGTKARATSPKLDAEDKAVLEREAIKVVNSLPQMKPGKHNGQVTGVVYAVKL